LIGVIGMVGTIGTIGLIGRKLGMTQVFSADGGRVPVTVIQAGPCTVVQKRGVERDGYNAVQLGFGQRKPQRVSKAYRVHCQRAGKGVFEVLSEFRTDEVEGLEAGSELTAAGLFRPGDAVDISGVTKGRGYAGVIRRHGFSGFPASHGTHEYFRHGGAIGNRSYPGRIFKGKGMAGQLGGVRVTTKNLRIVAVRGDEHVVLVRGAVPGPRGGIVLVRKAVVRGGEAQGSQDDAR
jgi:large subunit ribosomal protein L3